MQLSYMGITIWEPKRSFTSRPHIVWGGLQLVSSVIPSDIIAYPSRSSTPKLPCEALSSIRRPASQYIRLGLLPRICDAERDSVCSIPVCIFIPGATCFEVYDFLEG